MSGEPLLIRADASAEIGVGHVMRCIALAQAWQTRGGRVIFALAQGAHELEERIRSEGAEVVPIHAQPGSPEDAAWTAGMYSKFERTWIVLDGYHFPPSYYAGIKREKHRLLVMDDSETRQSSPCDILVNSDPHVNDDLYIDRDLHTHYLLGPKYALLRREFLQSRRDKSDVAKTAKRVLITLGGGDGENVTLQVVDALQEIKDVRLELTVVVGASNPNQMSLQAAVERSRHKTTLLSNVRNMPDLMNKSDLAITAGGGTCYELALMKVPMVLITTARNHEQAVKAFDSAGAGFTVGWFNSLTSDSLATSVQTVIGDQKLRSELQTNASRMVDGKGAERVVEVMRQIPVGVAKN